MRTQLLTTAALLTTLSISQIARAELPLVIPGATCSPVRNNMSAAVADSMYTTAFLDGGFHIASTQTVFGGANPIIVCPIAKAHGDEVSQVTAQFRVDVDGQNGSTSRSVRTLNCVLRLQYLTGLVAETVYSGALTPAKGSLLSVPFPVSFPNGGANMSLSLACGMMGVTLQSILVE